MAAAATWAGEFHAHFEAPLADPVSALEWLPRYDAAYYAGWARRTLALTGAARDWLARLCTRFAEAAGELFQAPPAVIHGEYYPQNLLVRDGTVYPVDWESVAVAPGEIDLASLTQGWPEEVAVACRAAYSEARWPAGAPADLDRRLDEAGLYLALRWLGEWHQWTNDPGAEPWFSLVRHLGERLALL